MTSAYPLQWPQGWARTASRSSSSPFKTSFDRARRQLLEALRLMRARDVVVSSNLPLRNDGAPYADVARYRISDPGVAVYFTLKNNPLVMARDAYWTVHDNMRSLTLAIEGFRSLERHGGAGMMERAFTGFAALPDYSNEAPKPAWWAVLGFPKDPTEGLDADLRGDMLCAAEARFKARAKTEHPDAGGTHARMTDLLGALEEARRVLA